MQQKPPPSQQALIVNSDAETMHLNGSTRGKLSPLRGSMPTG